MLTRGHRFAVMPIAALVAMASAAGPSAATASARLVIVESSSTRVSAAKRAYVTRPRGSLAWHPCRAPSTASVELDCANLAVPIDHANPGGPALTLALNRLRTTSPKARIGVLIVNPGGPGGSGLALVDSLAEQRAARDPRAGFTTRFDLIGFDPRGVGSSTKLRCAQRKELEVGIPADSPTAEAEILTRWTSSCRENSGNLLEHMATRDSADDIDAIRAALGETEISYIGFSYGTLLGAVYAARHPTRLRSAVLDAAVDPQSYTRGRSADRARQREARLDRFLAECAASVACKFNNGTDLAARLNALLDRFDATPMEEDPVNGRVRVSGHTIRRILAYDLEEASDWSVVATVLDQLDHAIRSEYFRVTETNSDGDELPDAAFLATSCQDGAFPTSPQDLDLAREQVRSVAPRLHPVFSAQVDRCVGWPASRIPLPSMHWTAKRAALVIGSTDDPVTPFTWSQALSAQLGNSVLLTRKGEGHTSTGRNRCVDDIVTTYLNTLVLPKAGTIC